MTREEAVEQLKICKDLIKQCGQDYLDERDFPLLDIAIEALSANAVEIIMCKDCIRINTDDCPWNTKEYHMGTIDFCSWGEREDYLLNNERYRGCDTCKNNNLEWYEEPCDSCTVGGKNDHYERETK